MRSNLHQIKSDKQLHELLARAFGFPDFYGKNWDAFWDCITDLAALPPSIHFVGTQSLQVVLPNTYSAMKQCFDDLAKDNPDIHCTVEWD